MTRTTFVVNPRSDGGRTGDAFAAIERRARRILGPIRVVFTTARGEGRSLTRAALEGGATIVVAVGGDGTLSEVASGFFDVDERIRASAVFAFLQRGTGGDFQRSLGLSGEIDDTLRAIDAAQADPLARTRLIDVGHARFTDHDGHPAERTFLNIASFGIGGVFDAELNASKKPLGRRAATTLTGLRVLATFEHPRVSVQLDRGAPRVVRVHNVAVANGQYYGGGQHIAPDASLDDGRFDVVCVGDLGVTEKIRFAASVTSGEHVSMHRVDVARATRVEAMPLPDETQDGRPVGRVSAPVLLDLDGEQPGRLPAVFTVRARALRLCAPLGAA
jgi:YegS/Rv2252/BmrU family lipid kinase